MSALRRWTPPLLLLLSACASTGPSGPAAGTSFPRSHGVMLTEADKANPVGGLRRAGAPDAMTPEGARILFGKADVERRDGKGAILTYKTASCALVLMFAADRTGDLRLDLVDAAARDQRASNPPLDQCVSEALARAGTS